MAFHFPTGGAWRVGPSPIAFPHLVGPDERPPHRFDDPEREYRVLYAAEELLAAFAECLAPFRVSERCEERFQSLRNRQPREVLPMAGEVPLGWLLRQKAARVVVGPKCGPFVDLTSSSEMELFMGDSEVKDVLVALEVGGELAPGHMLLDGDIGRRLTQRVSRLAYSMEKSGFKYQSKLELSKGCWAVFDREEVAGVGERFSVADQHDFVMAALSEACESLGLSLPEGWQP